eukprot:jgi/Botrbrau1/3288/Bobra.174_1s0052.1
MAVQGLDSSPRGLKSTAGEQKGPFSSYLHLDASDVVGMYCSTFAVVANMFSHISLKLAASVALMRTLFNNHLKRQRHWYYQSVVLKRNQHHICIYRRYRSVSKPVFR